METISKTEQLNLTLMKVHISGLERIKKVFQNSFDNVLGYGFDELTPALRADMSATDLQRYGGIFFKNLKYRESDA